MVGAISPPNIGAFNCLTFLQFAFSKVEGGCHISPLRGGEGGVLEVVGAISPPNKPLLLPRHFLPTTATILDTALHSCTVGCSKVANLDVFYMHEDKMQ